MAPGIFISLLMGVIFPGKQNFGILNYYDYQGVVKIYSLFSGPETFCGLYQGYFGSSPIEITLELVGENGTVTGFSLHKGIKRPLKGTWGQLEGTTKVRFILNEPGDHKYDGYFELFIDPETFEAGGKWYPKPGSQLSEMTVILKKKT